MTLMKWWPSKRHQKSVLPKSETNSGQALKGIGKTRWVFFVCKQFSWTEVNDEYVASDVCLEGLWNSLGMCSSLCRTTENWKRQDYWHKDDERHENEDYVHLTNETKI